MTLRQEIQDECRAGNIGRNGVVSRAEIIEHFAGYSPSYTGVILSNSEMYTGQHSPTNEKFTQRLARGVYLIRH